MHGNSARRHACYLSPQSGLDDHRQNYAHDTLKADISVVQDKIGAQDLLIVNAQCPELLPLKLQVEMHLQSDRIAIAYRRWLHRLGLTFGTV